MDDDLDVYNQSSLVDSKLNFFVFISFASILDFKLVLVIL